MADGICKTEGCTNPWRTWQLCPKCYGREWRKRKAEGRGCCEDCGCDLPYSGVGRPRFKCDDCQAKKRASKICSVEGCDSVVNARGWCCGHYSRWRKTGDVGEAIDLRRCGGVRIADNGHGYIRVWIPDETEPGRGRHVMQHRLVMEQHLGRKLFPNENVHHKNGIRDDNRIENLELWVKPQSPGQRAEDLVKFAIQILQKYAPDALK
jgi:hypothetical protein